MWEERREGGTYNLLRIRTIKKLNPSNYLLKKNIETLWKISRHLPDLS